MEIRRALSGKVLQTWLDHNHLRIKELKLLQRKFKGNNPFQHIEISHFLKEDKAKELLQSLSKEKFSEIESDLFKFMQTKDFSNIKNKSLKSFHQLFSSIELASYIRQITETKTSCNVSMSGSLYQNTDYLLPHDDQLENRKIAYIYYLSNFKPTEGGKLILFKTKNKKPIEAEKAICPKFNKLVLFKVSPKSYHEVEEVIVNKQRIAIGGWFHA